MYWKCVCFWCSSPQWARSSSFTVFLNHAQRHTTVGRTSLDEWSAYWKCVYGCILREGKGEAYLEGCHYRGSSDFYTFQKTQPYLFSTWPVRNESKREFHKTLPRVKLQFNMQIFKNLNRVSKSVRDLSHACSHSYPAWFVWKFSSLSWHFDRFFLRVLPMPWESHYSTNASLVCRFAWWTSVSTTFVLGSRPSLCLSGLDEKISLKTGFSYVSKRTPPPAAPAHLKQLDNPWPTCNSIFGPPPRPSY